MTTLRLEVRAFWASTLKTWRIMRRYPVNLIAPAAWALMVPAAYVGMASGFQGDDPRALVAFADRSGTTDVPAFLYLGWSMYIWLTVVLWGPGMAIREERVRGSLESILLTRTSRFTLLFGGALAQLMPALAVFASSVAALVFIFGTPVGAGDVILALVVIVAALPVLMAMAAVFSTLSLQFKDAQGLVEIIRAVTVLLCGVSFPLAVLPDWAQVVGNLLPPTHIIALLRESMLGLVSPGSLIMRLLVLLLVAAGIGAFATGVLRWSLARARRTGKLGQF